MYKRMTRMIGSFIETVGVFVKKYFFVAALFFILTVIVTYPLVNNVLTRIPGYGDALTYLWTLWWFHHAVAVLHQNPLFTNFQFYPEVINISQDVSLLHGVYALPIISWLGVYAGYNAVIFFTYVVTGLGFYIFFRSLIISKTAAFIGSCLFTFSYYRNIRVTEGHVDIASTEWYGFVLYFLTAIFYFGKNSRRNIFGAALFLSLCAYTEYRNFFYIALFFGLFVLVSTIVQMARSKRHEVKALLIAQTESFISVALIVWFMLLPLFIINLSKIGDVQYAPTYPSFNAYAPAFILPPCSTHLGQILPRCFSSPVYEGGMVYLGITSVLFSLYYLILRSRKRDWGIVMLFGSLIVIFILLSLGTKTPLYSWLFDNMPLFKVVRVPSRLVVLVGACLSVISAMGVHAMLQRSAAPQRLMIIVFATILFIAEGAVSNEKYVYDSAGVSPHLAVLEASNSYSLLEIPFGFRGNIYETFGSHNTGQSFYYQMRHQIPLIGGYMSMIDFSTWRNISEDSLLIKLVNCQEISVCEPLSDIEKQAFSQKYKVKYVSFLSNNYMHLEQYLKSNLNLQVVYRDGTKAVFQNSSLVADAD